MRDRPLGAELLDIARKVLREELMPLLPRDKVYTVLMTANAMTIAARQLQIGEEPQQQELDQLRAVLANFEVDETLPLREQLTLLTKELARRIRTGEYNDQNEEVKKFLWETTVQRVRESSPRYLKVEGIK